MKILPMLLMGLFASTLWADGVHGYWKSIDDETGQAKSIVHVWEENGKTHGRVVRVLTNREARAKLPGSPKIEGLQIIWDLVKDGDKYTGGKILDPKKGKTYSCQIWLENGNLIVRGSLLCFGRKQTWYSAKAPATMDPQSSKSVSASK